MKIRHRRAETLDEMDQSDLESIDPRELLAGELHKTIDPVIAAMKAKEEQ